MGPVPWSQANPTVMSHCRGSEWWVYILKARPLNTQSGCLKLPQRLFLQGGHPISHHFPESTPRESRHRQFSDAAPWRRQELPLGMMDPGDTNTAKIPLINHVPPLDQWLALGELSTILLLWLASCRCYRWRNKTRRRGKKDKIISLKGAKEHPLYFVFRFRAALGAHTTIHFYAVSRSSVQPPDFPLYLTAKIPGASGP